MNNRTAAMLRRHGERRARNAWETMRGKELVGIHWYPEATAWAADVADREGISLDRMAAIVAVLSPRNRWGRNKALAEMAAAGINLEGRTMGLNARKAARLMEGEAPGTVVSGMKTRSFWPNIAGDYSYVTIDTWTGRVITGRDYNHGGAHFLERKGVYDLYADAIRTVAYDVGMEPAIFQASILWIPVVKGELS